MKMGRERFELSTFRYPKSKGLFWLKNPVLSVERSNQAKLPAHNERHKAKYYLKFRFKNKSDMGNNSHVAL